MTSTSAPAPAGRSGVVAAGASPAGGGDEPVVDEGRAARTVAVIFAALFAVPFGAALVALASPRWFPLLDLAQTEMRLRDVPTSHPPLIGLPGRIGTLDQIGSHPGPISFWVLWPFYRLFGGSAWAADAAAASLNVIAIALALWIARRRGGVSAVLGVAAAFAILVRFYGPEVLTQPWNPYMPLLWWLVFVLALWSVLCGDRPPVLVAAFAGTFIMQTHISYLGLAAGLTGLTAGAVLLRSAFRRTRRPADPSAAPARTGPPWGLIAVGALTLLWLPPLLDQLTNSPGNLSILWRHFTAPPEEPIGLQRGVELMLVHLNPWRLLAGQDATTGAIVPGVVFLAVWVAAVVCAWRLREESLLWLDGLLGAALLIGTASAARIFGHVWYYLLLWAWGIAALMALTIWWTAVLLLARRRAGPASRRNVAVVRAATAAVAVLALVSFTFDSARVDQPTPEVSEALGRLARATGRALDAGTAPGGGRGGRYSITWTDPIDIGAQGYGLLLELERQGFDVGFPRRFRATVTPRRVIDPKDATAVIHVAVGDDIALWAAKPGAVRVAYDDRRSAAERVEYDRLEREVDAELRADGRTDLLESVRNVFTATYDPRVPRPVQDRLRRMQLIGLPVAVFVGPPSLENRS